MRPRVRVPLLAAFAAAAIIGLLATAAGALATDFRVIPTSGARYMWQNGNGYCGECSLQIAGISRGYWVSQDQARKLAGSEALLGVNYDTMLNKLHLRIQYNAADEQELMTFTRGLAQAHEGVTRVQTTVLPTLIKDITDWPAPGGE